MSAPLLVGLLILAVVVAAAAGVWRARRTGATGVQSAVGVLVAVLAAAVLAWVALRGR
jgi:hypothetical protein